MQSSSKIEEMFRESKTLRLLGHKNIIALYHSFVIDKNVVLVMEFCSGGELFNYAKEQGQIPEIEVRRLLL